jgi:TRAP transporter TAXI family solute receptor
MKQKRTECKTKSWKLIHVVMALAMVLLLLSVSPANAAQKLLTMGTTSGSSGYFATNVTWAKIINKYLPEVNITPIETGATVDNAKRLGRGELELAFGSAIPEYQSYMGIGKFENQQVKKIRQAWIWDYATFNYLVRASAGVNSVKDLEGKKFNVGIPGSSTELSSVAFLKAAGVEVTPERSSTKDSLASIQDNRIVGMVKGCANPDSAILSLMATTPIKILSLSDEDLNKLFEKFPYLIKMTIKDDVYPKIPAFSTYAMTTGISMSADIPQELQYKIVKTAYNHLDEFLTSQPRFEKFGDPLELTNSKAVIPLAAGTVQFLKEKGFTVPARLIPPEYKD